MSDPYPLTPADVAIVTAERLLKVAQVGILLNCSEKTVRRLYRAGHLPYRRMARGGIRIPLAAVLVFRAHHPRAGRD